MREVVRSPKEIMAMLDARRRQFEMRNSLYENLLTYYFGKQAHRGGATHETMAMNQVGRPLLRDLGVSIDAHRTYVSNRLGPVVDDYQALIGRMPTVRVDPPDASEQAETKAEKETKYLYSRYRFSDFELHQAVAGFHLACLGDAVYIVEPDFDNDTILLGVVDPMFSYPSFRRGPFQFDLYDLVLANSWSPEALKVEYPDFTPDSEKPEDLVVITYISPFQRTVLVGERAHQVAHVEWKLDNCPAVWCWNKLNGQYATSDIAMSLGHQDFMDFVLNVAADGVVEMTYPIRVIKNPVDLPDGPQPIGPGANITVGPDGGVQVLNPTPEPRAAMMLLEHALQDLNASAGTSPVRQEGQMKGSIVTGRAVHAVQGPQSTRIDLKQIINGAALTKINARALELQEKAPLFADSIEIHGRHRGKAFREEFKPKEDIDGWYQNSVRFEDTVGMNRQQKVMVAFEGLQAQLWDDLYAMEQVGVEDPLEMRKRIESMNRWKAQMQAELAQAQQGQAPGGAGPPGAPGPAGPGAGPGGPPPNSQGGAPSPALVMRPPMAGPGAQGPVGPLGGAPQGVTLDAVRQKVTAIADKLRGRVYAIGELATEQQALKVQLRISDPRDYQPLKQALSDLGVKLDVRYMSEEKMPPEKVAVDL